MATLAYPLRRPRLKELLEDLGFDMNALPQAARHRLLVPVGVRPFDFLYHKPGPDGIRRGPEAVEGDANIGWTAYSLLDVDTAQTASCFWDFLGIADSDAAGVLSFVRRWGLYSKPGMWDGSGSFAVAELIERARSHRNLLVTLVASSAGEQVSEDVLLGVAEFGSAFDFARPEDSREVVRRLGLDPDDENNLPDHVIYPVFQEVRLERWRAMRRAGDGLALQSDLLVSLLNSYVTVGEFVWDERGRRTERTATGVREIFWSHLSALFMASELDVFLCAICGKPFEFDSQTAQRRPRSGKRRFCSEECRKEGKRESNRNAWRQNGARWRPRKIGVEDGKA